MTDTPTPIAPGALLTLHYRLRGPDGADVVSTFGSTPATVTLGEGLLADALEACLTQMREGQHAQFELAPDATFGAHLPERVQRISNKLLAAHAASPGVRYAVGDMLEFPTPDGSGRLLGAVRAVHQDGLEVDFNHPLAGVPLTFEAQLIAVL